MAIRTAGLVGRVTSSINTPLLALSGSLSAPMPKTRARTHQGLRRPTEALTNAALASCPTATKHMLMNIGRLLKERRKQHGLDQAELAKLANTSQGQISRIERGAISPTWATLEKIFKAMGDDLELQVWRSPRKIMAKQPNAPRTFRDLISGEQLFYDQDFCRNRCK